MGKLSQATDVVALLTQNSIDRPWILYEAGVAKGKLNTPVFGVAIGIPLEKASTGPFAQFQNCADDITSLTKLAVQLIRRNPIASPREEAVRRHVEEFHNNVEKLLKKKGTSSPSGNAQVINETTIAKLFEEVKIMFRALPDNVEEILGKSFKKGALRKDREIRPMFIEYLLFHPRLSDKFVSPGIGWLIFISFFKDDLPWFYEIGLELYRALESRDPQEISNSAHKLQNCFELYFHSPISEFVGGLEDKANFRIFRHFPELLERYLINLENIKPSKKFQKS